MNGIEVPYMPISNFDVSEICKNFTDTLSEEEETTISCNQYLKTSAHDSRDNISEEIFFILIGMGMEKYVDIFKKERVLLDTFLNLSDTDLQELGITDPKDREIIVKSLSIHRTNTEELIVPEDHVGDLKIITNISHQLLLMQNYCAYVELQMKKHNLTDYKTDKEESACMYLKAFTKAALIQSQKLNQAIYDAQDSLINRVLKAYNLVLPSSLERSLPKEKKKKKLYVLKLVSVIGFSSVVVLSIKYFFSRI